MTRETKWNLLFLLAFCAISLPGAVMLTKKKMRPGATPAPLSSPDPVRRRLVYMAPQVTSDQVARYVPPLTREWLAQIDRARGGSGEFLMRDRQPVLSDNRVLQVLNSSTNQAKTSLALIIWDESLIDPPHVAAGGNVGQVEQFDTIEVPRHVRAELQDGGYVTPPRRIFWLRVRFTPPFAQGQFTQVQVRTGDVSNPAATSVNLFTS
jgi:hypothetical protein